LRCHQPGFDNCQPPVAASIGSSEYGILEPGLFTVTVSETDEYVFGITGKAATGKVIIKNLGNTEK